MILLHNWIENFKIKITYQTKIYSSFFKKEQRRALRTYPLLEISKKFIFDGIDAQDFLAKKYEYLYVPIDVEFFTGTRSALKITATSSIADFFFMKNLNNVYVIDENGNIAKISSIVGSVINLTTAISGTSTSFWTCIKAFTKALDIQYITNQILSANVVFQQVKE